MDATLLLRTRGTGLGLVGTAVPRGTIPFCSVRKDKDGRDELHPHSPWGVWVLVLRRSSFLHVVTNWRVIHRYVVVPIYVLPSAKAFEGQVEVMVAFFGCVAI